MLNPGQSGPSSTRSEAESVYVVHTPFLALQIVETNSRTQSERVRFYFVLTF